MSEREPESDVALDVAPTEDGLTIVDRSPLDVDETRLVDGVEAVLFLADEPVAAVAIAESLALPLARVERAIAAVGVRLAQRGSGIELREAAGGWRLYTTEATRPVLERWVLSGRTGRLTQAALETLAVIAYKQPISRQEIGDVRGVNPDAAVRSLVARGYVEEVGRDPGPGQAVLYGTTAAFLERLGVASLDELPALAGFLADAPAPDEVAPDSLREVRRRLRAGGELDVPTPGPGTTDEDDEDDLLPPPVAATTLGEGEMDELTGRLDRAARSAASRLRSVMAATRPETGEPAGDAGGEAADDAAGDAGSDPVDGAAPEDGPGGDRG